MYLYVLYMFICIYMIVMYCIYIYIYIFIIIVYIYIYYYYFSYIFIYLFIIYYSLQFSFSVTKNNAFYYPTKISVNRQKMSCLFLQGAHDVFDHGHAHRVPQCTHPVAFRHAFGIVVWKPLQSFHFDRQYSP